MPRAGLKGKYKLTKHEYLTVYHFAMQYQEWIDRRNAISDMSQGIRYDKEKIQTSPSPDGVENVAIVMAELDDNIKLVEDTAEETDPALKPYIMKAVTNEGITYDYLRQFMLIPCGKNFYYDKRRKFYYLLAKKIIKVGDTGYVSR